MNTGFQESANQKWITQLCLEPARLGRDNLNRSRYGFGGIAFGMSSGALLRSTVPSCTCQRLIVARCEGSLSAALGAGVVDWFALLRYPQPVVSLLQKVPFFAAVDVMPAFQHFM